MGSRAAVLFDLDGTLIDPRRGIVASYAETCRVLGLAPATDAEIATLIGPPLPEALRRRWELEGEELTTAVATFRGHYAEEAVLDFDVFDGIPELLARLHDAGTLVAIATSKPLDFALRIVEHAGWSAAIDLVAGSGLDGSLPTKRDVVEDVLRRLGPCQPALMVGDRAEDVLGAAAVAIETVGVTWGFGSRLDLVTAGAVAVVDDVEGLEAEVGRRLSR